MKRIIIIFLIFVLIFTGGFFIYHTTINPYSERNLKKITKKELSFLPMEIQAIFKAAHREALKDSSAGQLVAGAIYIDLGLDSRTHFRKAEYWLTKAAAQGRDAAQYNLGRIYFSRYDYKTSDIEKAKFWLTKAAEQDNAEALYLLSKIHAKSGFEPDAQKEYNYLQKAAALEYPPPRRILRFCRRTIKVILQKTKNTS
ncbi:TPR repeat protein [Elusimicrobium posterum]|uniref:tetratricopeptide repeat protein n=1 Tax=Elusimicrobium posterum TaxID=3116653 RepID=UPI003C75BB48